MRNTDLVSENRFDLMTHICVARPQWVKLFICCTDFCHRWRPSTHHDKVRSSSEGWRSSKSPSTWPQTPRPSSHSRTKRSVHILTATDTEAWGRDQVGLRDCVNRAYKSQIAHNYASDAHSSSKSPIPSLDSC